MEDLILISIGLLLIGIVGLRLKTEKFTGLDECLDEVHSFIENNGGNHVSHLAFLNDKEIYRTKNNRVLIVFRSIGKKFIVLGDPIGKEEYIQDALVEFQGYCREMKKIPEFYQISDRFLPYYRAAGYQFFKLGEEAKVDLHEFTLAGKKGAKLRTRQNKFTRNGYQFHVSFPGHSKLFLTEIQRISDLWLGNRKEKGYSVGFFCENYLSRFPIGYLTNSEGEIIAFASLACDKQQENRTITVDLMRHSPDCPHGTMDMLFLSIFQWCKENGYTWCSLGMSPLSNVGLSKESSMYEKIARYVFEHGNKFYKFKGLHEYKNKFAPSWESRYLAYKEPFLPVVLFQLIALIHKKRTKKPQGILIRGLRRVS